MPIHQLFHKDDPDTSREAAESIVESIPRQHRFIMTIFDKSILPVAAEEISRRLRVWLQVEMSPVQISRRLRELVTKGKIECTEERHQNASGRWAYKYRRVA